MKTSNIIILLFIGSFFLVSAVGFTLGRFYPPDHNINVNTESLDFNEFSVVVLKGASINISLGEVNRLTFYNTEYSDNKEDVDLATHEFEVRNDTLFISRIRNSFRIQRGMNLSAKSLKSIVMHEKTMMGLEEGNFDSLRIKCYDSNSNFYGNVKTEYLAIETRGQSFHDLGTVRHLKIDSDGSRVQANGTSMVEGKISKISELHLNNADPKIDLQIDASSKLFIQ